MRLGRFLERWWPLALVALGGVNLIRYSTHRWALTGPLLAMAAGVLILLSTIGSLTGPIYPLLWPAAMAVAGVTLALIGAPWEDPQLPYRRQLRQFICLRGKRLSSQASSFRRADVTVVLGAFELDLRSAELHPKATVNVNVLFGSLDILVGGDVTVWERHPFVLGGHGLQAGVPPLGSARLTVNVLGLFGRARVTKSGLRQPPEPSTATSQAGSVSGQRSPEGTDRPRRGAGSRGSRRGGRPGRGRAG